jgi:hypothetical protein
LEVLPQKHTATNNADNETAMARSKKIPRSSTQTNNSNDNEAHLTSNRNDTIAGAVTYNQSGQETKQNVNQTEGVASDEERETPINNEDHDTGIATEDEVSNETKEQQQVPENDVGSSSSLSDIGELDTAEDDIKRDWEIDGVLDIFAESGWLSTTKPTVLDARTVTALQDLSQLTRGRKVDVMDMLRRRYERRQKGRDHKKSVGANWPVKEQNLRDDLDELIVLAQDGTFPKKRMPTKKGREEGDEGDESEEEDSAGEGPSHTRKKSINKDDANHLPSRRRKREGADDEAHQAEIGVRTNGQDQMHSEALDPRNINLDIRSTQMGEDVTNPTPDDGFPSPNEEGISNGEKRQRFINEIYHYWGITSLVTAFPLHVFSPKCEQDVDVPLGILERLWQLAQDTEGRWDEVSRIFLARFRDRKRQYDKSTMKEILEIRRHFLNARGLGPQPTLEVDGLVIVEGPEQGNTNNGLPYPNRPTSGEPRYAANIPVSSEPHSNYGPEMDWVDIYNDRFQRTRSPQPPPSVQLRRRSSSVPPAQNYEEKQDLAHVNRLLELANQELATAIDALRKLEADVTVAKDRRDIACMEGYYNGGELDIRKAKLAVSEAQVRVEKAWVEIGKARNKVRSHDGAGV